MTLTPKSQILKALDILYQRSIAFLLLSMSITLAIALFLSSGITKKLASLTEAATRIGAGDFKQNRNVKSNDEVGVLSRAFQAMGTEIERLLIETKDKVRMEAELKTASLVQESLFPARANFISGTFEVSGHYATSTECGGDWWYYFERDGALYIAIADATGHGTPAALITSAARSVFSTLETSKMTLQEMMTAWDHAVASCSNGKVFMTAQLYRFEIASGRVDYINASHEPPLHLKYECEKFEGEYIVPQTNSTLGEKRGGAWAEEKFQIDAGQSIVLLTDGVFALEDPEKKTLGDRRLARLICKESAYPLSAAKLLTTIQGILEHHRAGTAYPDDVTIVVVTRKA